MKESIIKLLEIAEKNYSLKVADDIIDKIDTLLSSGQFQTVAEILDSIDPVKLSPTLVSSILTITRFATEELGSSREKLVLKFLEEALPGWTLDKEIINSAKKRFRPILKTAVEQ